MLSEVVPPFRVPISSSEGTGPRLPLETTPTHCDPFTGGQPSGRVQRAEEPSSAGAASAEAARRSKLLRGMPTRFGWPGDSTGEAAWRERGSPLSNGVLHAF